MLYQAVVSATWPAAKSKYLAQVAQSLWQGTERANLGARILYIYNPVICETR